GDNVAEYAQKFRSRPGKRDGLFWEVKTGDAPSPLGALFAAAERQGYRSLRTASGPTPFHGYQYRILLAQGDKAPDGARSYVIKGKMIGGFAVIAFPVRYGVSGFKSFMVNHDGDVYEADLGPGTDGIASATRAFNPDPRWKKI